MNISFKFGTALLVLVSGIASAQTPTLSGVVNAASGIVAGFPNSGLAQGSIILILGTGMGPSTVTVASAAFQTTSLAGTSASVTANGQTLPIPLYYTSATQVSGLLPSGTPLGSANVTVTYNGKTSAPAPITVVQSNLGIFTASQNGAGAAIITYPDYSLVTAAKAANPGDVLILWATGLGPVAGSDTSTAQLGVNMPNVPLKVWLGGVQAAVAYQGRSGCCIAEDQIVFTVPANVPTGCAVPLAVQINDQISNYTLVPVASGSRLCTMFDPANSSAGMAKFDGGGSVSFAMFELHRKPNSAGTGNIDEIVPAAATVTAPVWVQPFLSTYADSLPLGTCTVNNSTDASPGQDIPFTILGGMDYGRLTVTGPNGSVTLTSSNTLSATGNFLSPGSYTLSSTGSNQVGAFTVPFTIPTPPTWTNQPGTGSGGITSVVRSQGLTFNWTGGSQNSFLEVSGVGTIDSKHSVGSAFVCVVPTAAQTFTVPPSVLLAMPTTNGMTLGFSPNTYATPFSSKGLDQGTISTAYNANVLVTNVK